MGLYSRGLIFEWFFCQQIIGLIFEGAYNRGGLYSRFYGICLKNINVCGEILFLIKSYQSGRIVIKKSIKCYKIISRIKISVMQGLPKKQGQERGFKNKF